MATNPIPTFREFVLRGPAAALDRLLTQLPDFLPAAWYRDQESERQAQEVGSEEGAYRCYRFAGSPTLPEATLWLFVEVGQAQVVNIVAPSLFELGYERYNAILAQFAEVVTQAIAGVGAAIEVAPWREPTLEEVLQPEPARLFEQFAKLANPMTGTLQPADGERWQDFLISAHQQQVEPNEELLRRWLKAECHWPEQAIDHTLEEMHTGLELLRKYEQTLPRATYGRAA